MIPAVAFDQRPGEERHEGDAQQLGQRPPGEDVVQGGDGGEDGARADADEVVGDQTWRWRRWGRRLPVAVCFNCVCVGGGGLSPMSTEKKKTGMGMFRTGQVMLRNQLGVMGKKRRKRRKKNKQLRFSST